MKRVVLLVALAISLTFASHVQAHPGGWYWGRAHAQNYILTKFNTSDGYQMFDVQCDGIGRRRRGLYHHFRCYALDELNRYFTVILHPVSRYRAVVIKVNCDDTDSQYVCP